MKKLAMILLVLMTQSTLALANQDIIIQARFDREASEGMVRVLRNFMVKNNLGDPYNYTHPAPLTFDLSQAVDLPKDSQNWLRELQSLLRLSILDSDYRLRVEGVGYSIGDYVPEFQSAKTTEGRTEFVTVNSIRGIKLKAKLIAFDVELKRTQGGAPIRFSLELEGVEFELRPELVSEINMQWVTQLMPREFMLSLETVDISKIISQVVRRPELIDFDFKRFSIPEISLWVGNRELRLDRKKLLDHIQHRKEGLKKSLLDLMHTRQKLLFENLIADSPKEIMFSRRQFFDGMVQGIVQLEDLHADRLGVITLEYAGNFCSMAKGFIKGDCGASLMTQPKRSVSPEMLKRSLRSIRQRLVRQESSIAISVSEQYINQLLEATVERGLWERELANKPFRLGPGKAFMLAEEPGENFAFYMDIIYPLGRAQRVLVGRSELRFPVKFNISMQNVLVDGLPRFRITVNEVLLDEQVITFGLPHLGLPSNVQSVRFRGKVLDKIIEDIAAFKGQTLFEMELGEFKDTYLEELDFYSDGMGRATAVLGFR
jgi:hypothetical protein